MDWDNYMECKEAKSQREVQEDMEAPKELIGVNIFNGLQRDASKNMGRLFKALQKRLKGAKF